MTFFDWLSKLGIIGVVLLVFGFLIIIAAIVAVMLLGRFIFKIGDTTVRSEGATMPVKKYEKSLLEHDFFLNMNGVIYGKFSLDIDDPCKKVVIETFYRLICHTSFKAMTDFVKEFEDGKIEPVESLGLLASIIADYNWSSKKVEIELPDGRKMGSIPPRLIDIFDTWHDPHISLISDKCINIIRSQFHDDNRAKMASILDVIDLGYSLTLADLMLSANQMNGDLTAEIDQLTCKD